MSKFNSLFLSCAAALSLPAIADDMRSYQSYAGYTGLINIPNANIQAKGSVDLGYNNQLFDFSNKYEDGHNYIISIGLFDGLEVSGLIATNTMHDNFFEEGAGQFRDLSFNAKYQIPYIPKEWFSVALGVKDLGGAINHYNTYYAVASKEFWDLRFSAGIATNDNEIGQMDGVFGGVEYQVFDWFSLQAEYDAEAFNAGAKITIPKKWLYDIGELTFTSRFYSNTDYSEEDTYWGVNFSMPLSSEDKQNYKHVKVAPYVEPELNKQQPSYKISSDNGLGFLQSATAPVAAAETYTNNKQANQKALDQSRLSEQPNLSFESQQLKQALINDGFENIVVGFNSNTVFVNFENSVFNRNDIDAIGLVLGRISEIITAKHSQFNVQLAKTDIPLIAIKGSVANYREFITAGVAPNLDIKQGKATIPGGVTWAGTAEVSPYFKPRLELSPVMSNVYASDYGVFDYSLGIKADIDLPLWQGAGINVAAQTIVDESDDFEQWGVFDIYSLDEGIVNASFYQGFALPYGFYNQTQLGIFTDYYDYKFISNETAWLSPEGRHKITAKLAYFDYQDYQASREYQTLSYQYNWVEQDVTLHATAGNYFYGDSGVKLESRFWFGDAYIGVFYQNTDSQKAGVALNIPLTPRKDMHVTSFGQLKGKEDWRVSLGTQIGDRNFLVFNQAYAPSTAITLDNTLFKKGRLTSSYLYGNLARMKEAYESYK